MNPRWKKGGKCWIKRSYLLAHLSLRHEPGCKDLIKFYQDSEVVVYEMSEVQSFPIDKVLKD